MASNTNILTIDLEEWFVVEALAGRFARSEWAELESTVVRNSMRLLELLQAKRVRATWFVPPAGSSTIDEVAPLKSLST